MIILVVVIFPSSKMLKIFAVTQSKLVYKKALPFEGVGINKRESFGEKDSILSIIITLESKNQEKYYYPLKDTFIKRYPDLIRQYRRGKKPIPGSEIQ